VAENTVDAVVAPVVWAALGGAPAVLAHRAVNTLDAMVGHRTERYDRFGWASARADDLANWLPARVAAAGVAVLVPSRRREIRRAIREDAPRHPSPNGGVIEAAAAGALGVQLGGRNRYGDRVEDRGLLGRGGPPTAADARRAIALMRRLGGLVAAVAAAGSLAGWILRRGPGRGSPG
jgi:adenosylcobinamide-phosphate synthase